MTDFSIRTEINGLPYTFEGELPETVRSFRFVLRDDGSNKEVGFINAGKTFMGRDDSVYARFIKSYELAKGRGRYLMGNFLALSDARGWPVELSAQPEDPMILAYLSGWYSRLGFRKGDVHKDGTSALIRYPREPDLNQDIMKVMQSYQASRQKIFA